jgi:hypothetical protein
LTYNVWLNCSLRPFTALSCKISNRLWITHAPSPKQPRWVCDAIHFAQQPFVCPTVPSRARFPSPEKRNSSIFDVKSGLREFPLKYDNRRKWQKGAGRQKPFQPFARKAAPPW